jgi:hypothetical protein
MPLGPQPGEFALRTYLKNTYVSALPHTSTLMTTATALGSGEKFQLTVYTPEFILIQTTLNGFYLTVLPEGGLGLSLQIMENSLFTLAGPSIVGGPILGSGVSTIRTLDGHFLTAVGGGGQSSDPFHTDATAASTWEWFWVLKTGDLGSGYRYAIRPVGIASDYLAASLGGGFAVQSIERTPLSTDSQFTLIQVSDGYALQTPNGFNYVTAVNGGGIASGENLHTDATRISDWETFKIVDQGDGTYTIQTVSGFYLGVAEAAGGNISTRIDPPDTAPEIGYIAKFEFMMIPNQRQGLV